MGQWRLFVSLLILGAGLLAGPGRAHAQNSGLPGLGPPDAAEKKPTPPPPDPPDSSSGGASLDKPKAVEPPGPVKNPAPDDKPPPAPVGPPTPPDPPPPATPAAPPAPAGPIVMGEGGVSLEVVGPTEAGAGEMLAYEIRVRNSGLKPAARVRVEQQLTPELVLLGSDPHTEAQERRLTWDLGDLSGGDSRVIKLELKATATGKMRLLPTVSFTAITDQTRLVRPPLSVTVTGPEKVCVGAAVVYEIVVHNNQSQPQTEVVIRADLPDALRGTRGQHVEAKLGSLVPGETRNIRLEATAMSIGHFGTEVAVRAASGAQTRTRAPLEVTEPCLVLSMEGPRQVLGGEDVEIRLKMHNPGRAPASGVRLALQLPAGLDYVSAAAGGQLNPNDLAVEWLVGSLQSGEERIITVRLRGSHDGEWRLIGSAWSEQLGKSLSALCIRIVGKPELVLELPPQDRPVPRGGEGKYELRVCNRGTAAAAGVCLSLTLPDGLVVVKAEGPTHAEVGEQNVQFEAVAKLPPHTDAVYRIHVRGVTAGPGRLRAQVTASALSKPVRDDVALYVGRDGSTESSYRGSRPNP